MLVSDQQLCGLYLVTGINGVMAILSVLYKDIVTQPVRFCIIMLFAYELYTIF